MQHVFHQLCQNSYVGIKANRILRPVSAAGVRNVIQLFAVALGASLAACAQSSVVTKNSELVAPLGRHRWNTIERHRS